MRRLISRGYSQGRCLIAVILCLLTPVSVAVAQQTVTHELSGFDGVAASHGIQMVLTIGSAYSVTAESDEPRQLELLELNVHRGVLGAEMDRNLFSSFRAESWRVTVRVSMPELTEATASSGASISADRATGDEKQLSVSGGAQIRLDLVDSEEVSLTAASGSRISVEGGSCEALEVQASNGSSISAHGLRCSNVGVSASSGSDTLVFAEQMVEANASSGALIQVFGDQKVRDINSSSGGSITFP